MDSNVLPKGLSLPALFLNVNAFDENCQMIANKSNGKTVRIATKSIRSIPVLQRILDSSPVFKGLLCYSPDEAVYLAEAGFDDIMIGYPCWNEQALTKISKLNAQGYQITCMVDSEEQVEYLHRINEKVAGLFYLCMDIDMSTKFGSLHFGVRRSPINSEREAVRLARKIKSYPDLKLHGVMGYEAQIAGVTDRLPTSRIKNQVVSFLKERSIHEIHTRRKKIVQALAEEGIELSIVNGGGTGSMDSTAMDESVTEIAAGSGFYSPLLFDYYRDFRYKPALFYALPVVRKPAPNIYTCTSGGFIASGPHGKDKMPQPVYPPGGKLQPFEGAGEVQTPIYYENVSLNIGDPIIFRAAKAGEICERFQEIVCVENKRIVERYSTYRGDGQCFL
ncbi:amino acid deaminase/aldolase [Allobacillus sp. SKP8-2]|uniref:Amino acid deaminase/aldolase n=1 Tax=Allobacillus saliphilus TaxID=2912308 RepID=A0A941CW43_9BACI|nr:amino acid deaminase/aldolase [Allobacillus saliphilus]MBR7554952.1 amino acid deaminase/aldolase [Allobacillus saliphilus]